MGVADLLVLGDTVGDFNLSSASSFIESLLIALLAQGGLFSWEKRIIFQGLTRVLSLRHHQGSVLSTPLQSLPSSWNTHSQTALFSGLAGK